MVVIGPLTRKSPRTKAPVIPTTEHAEQSMLFQWAALAERQHPELAALFAMHCCTQT